MTRNGCANRRAKTRAGTLLVIVLVCLGVGTTIALTMLSSSLRARRQMRTEVQLEQTLWLLDAGKHRAAAQLGLQPDYAGETWSVRPSPVKRADATISIEVDRTAEKQAAVTVVARIAFARNPSHATQRSSTWTVPTIGEDDE